jgi:hypothetical protein
MLVEIDVPQQTSRELLDFLDRWCRELDCRDRELFEPLADFLEQLALEVEDEYADVW